MKQFRLLGIMTLVMLLTSCSDRVGAYKQLIARNESVTAKVTSKACHDHGRENYTFAVQGTAFTGHAYWIGTPCKEIPIGHALTVYYDPLDPTVNSSLPPAQAYAYHRDQLMNKIYIGLFLVTVFLVGRFRKGR